MTVEILNPNTPQYWIDVKTRASQRKGHAFVKLQMKNLRATMIYEQHVADVNRIVRQAAKIAQFSSDALAREFVQNCAAELGMPELVEAAPGEVERYSSEAVREASLALYGE